MATLAKTPSPAGRSGSIRRPAGVVFYCLSTLALILGLWFVMNLRQANGPLPKTAGPFDSSVHSLDFSIPRQAHLSWDQVKILVDGQLFKGVGAGIMIDPGPAPTIANNPPSLRLIGLVHGGPGASLAVVEDRATGKQHLVGPGDKVGSAFIGDIHPDRITVAIGGEVVWLSIPGDGLAAPSQGLPSVDAEGKVDLGRLAGLVFDAGTRQDSGRDDLDEAALAPIERPEGDDPATVVDPDQETSLSRHEEQVPIDKTD